MFWVNILKKKFCLIGYPLKHSYSDRIHQSLFKMNNYNAIYNFEEIKPYDLENSIIYLKNNYDGFNVTSPYKKNIINFLDELDFSARKVNAVNTVYNLKGKLIGYNTDIFGFEQFLKIKNIKLGCSACVIGSGGASNIVIFSLLNNKLSVTVAIRNCTSEKIKVIKSNYKNANLNVVDINNIEGYYDILVNATPVGMYPEVNNSVVGENVLKYVDTVIDLIYNPKVTKLMKLAQNYGCKIYNGYDMLIWQAIGAQNIWLGKDMYDFKK